MPFWPIYFVVSAGLILWGWRHDAWVAPALALLGFVLMRINVSYTSLELTEVVGGFAWLLIACGLLYCGAAIPAFFFALSALTYPVLLTFGFKIEYMGLTPIIADLFAVLALLTIGGGIYGMANPGGNRSRLVHWVQYYSAGMALRQDSLDRHTR